MAGSAEAWASASLVDLPCGSSTFAARDARDRFLPSSHSGASTRASLALDEVAPRRQASFSSPTCCPACLGPSYRAAPRFTTRERAETDGTGLVRGVFLPRAACSTESLAPLSIRSDQAASLLDATCSSTNPRPLLRNPREGLPLPRPKAPSIEASFLSTPDRDPTPRPRSNLSITPRASWKRAVVLPPRSRFPEVPSVAPRGPLFGRSERHRPRHPCTPVPLLAVLALPRCQTQLFDFCNTSNDTRSRFRSNAPSSPARWPFLFFGHHTLQTTRLGESLQRATRLDPDASHCLEAAPSEEEDPGPYPVSR
jgi:hypothetical protein